jgi:selenocysteine lyase/cysteine desulfurase
MLTLESRLRDFPSLNGRTYLNTAAEGISPRCVGDALQTYWHDKLQGMRGRDAHYAQVEGCREVAARWVGLQPDEVSFCSCSSEAYNLLATALDAHAPDEVIITDLDFPAGATPWLCATAPPVVRLWRARDGALCLEDLLALLNERTKLVQVSLVSFYNGFRFDWPPVRDLVRRRAPAALLSVDLTQALGRIALDCADADCLIASSYKWTLGVHGGCIVGIPRARATRLTTHAGGWFHLKNAFDADRFERATAKEGAPSFAVGMPNFPAIYALNASLRYLEGIGVAAISRHADPLVWRANEGLIELGLTPMAPLQARLPTGIVAFQHPRSAEIHAVLEKENIHVMHHAGRLRIAIHGYNTREDVERLLASLRRTLG